MRSTILLVVFPLVAACHPLPAAPPAPSPAFTRAMTMMCDVDRLASITPEAEPIGAGLKRTAWITEHVDHPDAIELRTLMSVKEPAVQAKMLRECSLGAGVARCALADSMERMGTGGLAP